ncbi:MAG: hypothetical protein WAV02_03425 [Stellaceae bacterium]
MSYLEPAFYLLCATVVLGGALALPYLRVIARRLPWPLRAAHGVSGTAALATLFWALYRGLPPSAMGTAGFGPASAVFIGLALLLGLAIVLFRVRPPGVLVAFHAGLAITGFVVLWTVVSLG